MTTNTKDNLQILGRTGFKYTDEFGVEYFIDSEMIVDKEYDFVVWSNSVQLYEDYKKQTQSDNIILTEKYDENKKCFVGKIEYKNKFVSNISKEEKKLIIKKVADLCKEHLKIRLDIEE